MNFFLNPVTLKSDFEYGDVDLVTEVENDLGEGLYKFNVILNSGEVRKLTFRTMGQARKAFLGIHISMMDRRI